MEDMTPCRENPCGPSSDFLRAGVPQKLSTAWPHSPTGQGAAGARNVSLLQSRGQITSDVAGGQLGAPQAAGGGARSGRGFMNSRLFMHRCCSLEVLGSSASEAPLNSWKT